MVQELCHIQQKAVSQAAGPREPPPCCQLHSYTVITAAGLRQVLLTCEVHHVGAVSQAGTPPPPKHKRKKNSEVKKSDNMNLDSTPTGHQPTLCVAPPPSQRLQLHINVETLLTHGGERCSGHWLLPVQEIFTQNISHRAFTPAWVSAGSGSRIRVRTAGCTHLK